MDPRPPAQNPRKKERDPFRAPVIRPDDDKEDQADSGPDRDNPVTQESKHPAPKHQPR